MAEFQVYDDGENIVVVLPKENIIKGTEYDEYFTVTDRGAYFKYLKANFFTAKDNHSVSASNLFYIFLDAIAYEAMLDGSGIVENDEIGNPGFDPYDW